VLLLIAPAEAGNGGGWQSFVIKLASRNRGDFTGGKRGEKYMGTHTVHLKDRREIANGTMAFYFEKPAGFGFVAGQSIDLTLLDPSETDAKGSLRTFSVASAPSEIDLMVATRMRDTAFKRELKKLPLGTALKLEGPFGSMTLHKNAARPAVFLAGGIGITPFRSMLFQNPQMNAGHQMTLFYSNRQPEDSAFLDELSQLAIQDPNFTLVATMTHLGDPQTNWNGERGYIGQAMLRKYLGSSGQPIYYIAGPPTLEAAMRKMLAEFGAEEDDINSEGFSGY
jgi:ferredoxin-NADP reductase